MKNQTVKIFWTRMPLGSVIPLLAINPQAFAVRAYIHSRGFEKKYFSSISLLRYKVRLAYKTMAAFRKGASKVYRKVI